MAGKKKVRDELVVAVDDDMMTEEETKVLDQESETETSTGGEGDVNQDEKDKEEAGKKEGDQEGKKSGETGDKKPGEGEGEKGGEVKPGEGGEVDPLKDARPVVIEINGEKVEGWIAKSGKYIIPFKDVEKRDEARRTLREENETLKALLEGAKTQLAKHEKSAAELAAGRGQVSGDVQAKADTKLDFKALGKKAYESEEDMAEVLEAVFSAGQKVGEARSGGGEGSEEQTGQEAQVLTPQQIEANARAKVALEMGIEKLLEEFPKLGDKDTEFICFQKAMSTLQEKLGPLSVEARTTFLQNPENILGLIREAATWTVGKLGSSDQRTPEQIQKEKDATRMEVLKEVGGKLKLSDDELRTLSGVTGGEGGVETTYSELNKMEGSALEEAVEKMSEEERNRFAKPES